MNVRSLVFIGVGAISTYYAYTSLKGWINKPPVFKVNKKGIRKKFYYGYKLLNNWIPCEETPSSFQNQCFDFFGHDEPKGLQVLADKMFYWIESAVLTSPDAYQREKTLKEFLELNNQETKYVINYFEKEIGANLYTLISEEWTLDETVKAPILAKITNLYKTTKMLKSGAVVLAGSALTYGGYKFAQKQKWLK